MTMKRWLIGWGILALLAFGAPSLVVLGMFLLLPGMILLAAPTVFLYSAGFALLRRYLPVPVGLLRNLAAGGLVLVLGWLVAQPWAVTEHRAFVRSVRPDVVGVIPVALTGQVRLELPKSRRPVRSEAGGCGALCAALLDTPGVESVIVDGTAFRLTTRGNDRSRGVFPVSPEAILAELPGEPGAVNPRDAAIRLAERKTEEQAIAAQWGLRLASREKLIAEPAGGAADMTIRVVEERGGRKGISISLVEIVDRGGVAHFRRSIVTGSALAAPLRFEGSGSMESYRIEPARDRLSNGPEYPPLKPVTELFLHSSLARPKVNEGAMPALLNRLGSAVGNPALAADDTDLGLAGLWLPTIDWRRRIPARQLAVLARVIADERIPLPKDFYSGYESRVAPELRGSLSARILKTSTPPETRLQLARLLAKMPSGTFETLSSDEKAILSDGTLRPDVYPMIARIADQGEASVPALLAILKSDAGIEPPGRRMRVMESVAKAFATLGPKASSALAEVDALVNEERSPLLHSWDDRKRWYLALARMGKPVDEFHWPNGRPAAVDRDRAELRRQVERFDRGSGGWFRP